MIKTSFKNEQEQIEYVNQDIFNILHISNPSNRVKIAAIKKNPWCILFIKTHLILLRRLPLK